MKELHQYIFLMQYLRLLFSIAYEFKKNIFLFFQIYIKIGLDVFLKYI